MKGHGDIATILLRHGANLEERTVCGMTPLLAACSMGHHEMALLLLDRGAKINRKNNNNESPLYSAASNGCCDVVRLLLKRGARHSASADGDTPLHVACIRGFTDVAEILLKNGAKVNRRGVYGRTALHHAATRHNRDMIRLLVDLGADVNSKDDHGNTPNDLIENVTIQSPRRSPLASLARANDVIRPHPKARTVPPRNREGSASSTDTLDRGFITLQKGNSVSTINAFMRQCHAQFVNAEGLVEIKYRTEMFAPQEGGPMQIMSKDGSQSQWLLVSRLRCSGSTVRVYDPNSSAGPLPHSVNCKIASLMRSTCADSGRLDLHMMKVQQAETDLDSGPLVMAFATEILLDRDPTGVWYKGGDDLRAHLFTALRTHRITQFPFRQQTKYLPPINPHSPIPATRHLQAHLPTRSPWLHLARFKYMLELLCLCRMPRDNDMRECDACGAHFHPSCIYGNIILPMDSSGRPYMQCIQCRPFPPDTIPMEPVNIFQMRYDLYVAYSSNDIRFVKDILLSRLDRRDGTGSYDLMVSDRDWPACGSVVDTMVETMRESMHALRDHLAQLPQRLLATARVAAHGSPASTHVGRHPHRPARQPRDESLPAHARRLAQLPRVERRPAQAARVLEALRAVPRPPAPRANTDAKQRPAGSDVRRRRGTRMNTQFVDRLAHYAKTIFIRCLVHVHVSYL